MITTPLRPLNFKKLENYRQNNEFYIDLINKIEEIKKEYMKNNKDIFYKVLKLLYDKKDFNILAKKDRRKLNREHLEEFYESFLEQENKQNKIIDTFFDNYYLSFSIIEELKNPLLNKVCSYQKYILNKVLYLNYPYVFKKITDYIKNNVGLKNHIDDIENTTLSIIISSIVKFKYDKKVKFITYLSYWIRYGIDEEVNYINKNNQTKFNNLSNFRFSNSDFFDKNIKNLINNTKDSKLINKLKKQQKEKFKDYVQNMIDMNMDFLEIFNIDKSVLDLTGFVKFLNNILKSRESRTILYNFFYLKKNIVFFKNNNIEVNNNKISLYKCLNLLLLNDFHHKTIPIYNIDDVSNSSLTFEINYNDDDIYYKLKKHLSDEENILLNKFQNEDIEDLPSFLRDKLSNIIKMNNEEMYYLIKHEM